MKITTSIMICFTFVSLAFCVTIAANAEPKAHCDPRGSYSCK